MTAARRIAHGVAGSLLALLAACAATATADAPSPTQNPASPPMSGPSPALRVPRPTIDNSCRANADCVVKDVGNCCGRMPACVNVDSHVDPAAVRAQCKKDGRMGLCGFRAISACQCAAGRCQPAISGNPAMLPGAAPPATPLPIRSGT